MDIFKGMSREEVELYYKNASSKANIFEANNCLVKAHDWREKALASCIELLRRWEPASAAKN